MKETILTLIRPVFVLVIGTIIIIAEFMHNAYIEIRNWIFWQTHRR